MRDIREIRQAIERVERTMLSLPLTDEAVPIICGSCSALNALRWAIGEDISDKLPDMQAVFEGIDDPDRN